MRKKFELWHSLTGLVAILICEGLLIATIQSLVINQWIILLCALFGSIVTVYVATEIVEEVKSPIHMLVLLSITVLEFLLFFTVQYHFVLQVVPTSFPTLLPDPATLLLHSTMIFVFNPLYLPSDWFGRTLLIINNFGALGLVLFILQNITQLRRE
jgi:hypothetical protein